MRIDVGRVVCRPGVSRRALIKRVLIGSPVGDQQGAGRWTRRKQAASYPGCAVESRTSGRAAWIAPKIEVRVLLKIIAGSEIREIGGIARHLTPCIHPLINRLQ